MGSGITLTGFILETLAVIMTIIMVVTCVLGISALISSPLHWRNRKEKNDE